MGREAPQCGRVRGSVRLVPRAGPGPCAFGLVRGPRPGSGLCDVCYRHHRQRPCRLAELLELSSESLRGEVLVGRVVFNYAFLLNIRKKDSE